MKPKIIIIALSVLFLFLGLFGWGYVDKSATTASVQGAGGSHSAKSSFSAAETFYDFGTISMKNGDVTKDFILANGTSTDTTIKSVETSCMCTSASLVLSDGSTKGPFGMPGMGGMTEANDSVKAGESRILRVVYNPNAHGPAGVGAIDRFITVTDTSGGSLQFEIKASVTP